MKKLFLLLVISALLAAAVSAETITYRTGEYEVYENAGYKIVAINNGEMLELEGELYEPASMQYYDIPSDKAIKSVSITKKSSPVSLSLDLPQIEYYGDTDYTSFEERECYENEREAYITSSADYSNESVLFVAYYPLEINDCEAGEFTLYQGIEIEIEYYGENKIKSVTHSKFVPGSTATIDFEFENVEENSEIIVMDSWWDEVAVEDVVSGRKTVSVEVPGDTAVVYFTVEYYENYEVVDRALVMEDLSWGSVDFRVLVSDDVAVFPLAVEIGNKEGKEIPVSLEIRSVNYDFEVNTTMQRTVQAAPGKSIHYIAFHVTEGEKANDIEIDATYNGITEYAGHNSLIRFTKEEVQGGLPPPPGVALSQEIAEILANESLSEEGSLDLKSESGKSNIIGIIIALALFAALGYFAIKYMKKE